jgi:hypothetical protein
MQLEMILLVIIRFVIINVFLISSVNIPAVLNVLSLDYRFSIDTIPGLIFFLFRQRLTLYQGRFAHISPLQKYDFKSELVNVPVRFQRGQSSRQFKMIIHQTRAEFVCFRVLKLPKEFEISRFL